MTTNITALAQRLKVAAKNGCCHTLFPDDCLALVEALEKAQTINAAAEKLVRCKGRYHSEQNYRALAALFGVTTPDLPPLDSESRTVTVSKSDIFNVPGGETYVGGEMISVDTLRLYLAEHGIKWEAE